MNHPRYRVRPSKLNPLPSYHREKTMKLTKKGAKRLLVVTIIAIVSYALGCLTHSEIMHFFAEILGLE